MQSLLRWLEERTGYHTALCELGDRPVPRGTRVLRLWPTAILFTFVVEAVTGFFLWMFYSPSAQTAWESVYYLQHEVMGGWVLRAMHYHAGQVLLGLIGLYILHMVFTRAYRAPRELLFTIAVLMGLVTLALLLTGDLLPWTQKGYWSTNVRTKYLLLLPGIGQYVYKLAVGGPVLGHLTLTRFFALHAGLFSAVFVALLWLHARVARRADAAVSTPRDSRWWPGHAAAGAVACAAVLVVIAAMVSTGVELGSPRDPVVNFDAARPDWYFVCLYQFAHIFPGSLEILPIFVLPGALALYFLVMPFIARRLPGHLLNLAATTGLLIAAGMLTSAALRSDREDPGYRASVAAEQADVARIEQLVQHTGIPPAGVLTLLRDDPKTQGPKLFKQHCAGCHDHAGGASDDILAQAPSAPNLKDYATVDWLSGFLDKKQLVQAPKAEELSPTNRPKYFGNTKLKDGKMIKFLRDDLKQLKEDVEGGEKAFHRLIDTLAAESHRQPGTKPAMEQIQLFEDFTCTSSGCHEFYGTGKVGSAPQLTGYGSQPWLMGIIGDPTHARFYGAKNDRMPSYAKSADKPKENILTARQVAMLAEWLRGTWYEPKESE
ncbi:MAG: cytochrome b N-terminal domain-containing protein [Thermoguttaceae bacterium]